MVRKTSTSLRGSVEVESSCRGEEETVLTRAGW